MRVWTQYGYYGKKIVIIIIDDGVETEHLDLKDNYVRVQVPIKIIFSTL